MEYIAEIACTALTLLFTWQHQRMNKLEERIEHCVDRDAFEEVKRDLKIALEILTETRVENARWQVLIEEALKKD